MNIGVILIETLILTVLFTIAVVAGSKNPVDTVYDMPQPIINRCLELGLIDESKKGGQPTDEKKEACRSNRNCAYNGAHAFLCKSCRQFFAGISDFVSHLADY